MIIAVFLVYRFFLGKNKKTFSGKFYFQKPDKVKIEYEKPFDQIIVSNDEKFWQYMPSQKTVRVAKWSELDISERPKLDFGLNILGQFREDYVLELKGAAELDGRETILINAVPNVKTEVKNIPAIKLPNNSNSFVEVNIFAKISVFAKITATIILIAIIAISCIKKFLLLVLII